MQLCFSLLRFASGLLHLGVDPAQASNFLAEYLPKIVDKLTPEGKVDPAADHQQGLANLLPAPLQSLGGKPSGGGGSGQA